jgi:hypothetical protein
MSYFIIEIIQLISETAFLSDWNTGHILIAEVIEVFLG